MNPRPFTEVPTPAQVCPGAPARTGGPWYICGPPVRERQGFKLYVSATPRAFPALLETVAMLWAYYIVGPMGASRKLSFKGAV